MIDLAEKLISDLNTDLARDGRIGKVRRYLDEDHDLPVAPGAAATRYRDMARKSVTNWLPQVSNTYTQGLFVDGFRRARTADNAAAWSHWQANGMDARQSITTRGALEFGTSYGLTLPSNGASPFMRPLSPERTIAFYEDDDDEWPVVGLYRRGKTVTGHALYEVFDDEFRYTILRDPDLGKLTFGGADYHGLGVCPLVRFRTRLGGPSRGVIRPLITVQDRVNETVFALTMALHYASFRQRWASGLKIERDAEGNPVESFDAAIDQLWVTDGTEARFGDFAQTDTRGHLEAYNSSVRTLAALGQISPNVLTGDLVNLSADALAQLQDATERQLAEFETLFGESYEQWFRLTALAAGDREGAIDTASEVRWRDTTARSLKETVDALGGMVTMLQVPPEVLWEKIPDVTDGDIQRWKEKASQADGLALLSAALDRQSAPTTAPEGAAA